MVNTNIIWNKTLFFAIILTVLMEVTATPAQNRTRARDNSRHNKTQVHDNSKHNQTQHAHAPVPKQNRVQVPAPKTAPKPSPRSTTKVNKTRAAHHVDNSKKTDLFPSSDELISDIIGLVLDIIGKISEIQEMFEDFPIIGKK